jgi:hypothetical protein
MLRWLRRLLWLGMLVGLAAAGYTIWQRRQREHDRPPVAPQSAALRLVPERDEPAAAAAATAAPITAGPAADMIPAQPAEEPRWVPPVDGACPDGYPIKASSSRIYHVPGGRSYARTVPERCYASTADAEADGYRAAKS